MSDGVTLRLVWPQWLPLVCEPLGGRSRLRRPLVAAPRRRPPSIASPRAVDDSTTLGGSSAIVLAGEL